MLCKFPIRVSLFLGEEYLQHVIYERTKKCKKWVTAEGDFTKFSKNQTVHVTKVSLNLIIQNSQFKLNWIYLASNCKYLEFYHFRLRRN